MFNQIINLLLVLFSGFFSGMFMFRAYMYFMKVPISKRAGNPTGDFVMAVTDWFIIPLRKITRTSMSKGRMDIASLLGMFLMQIFKYAILVYSAVNVVVITNVLVLSIFWILSTAISGIVVLVVLKAVLSWFQKSQGQSDMEFILDRLTVNFMRPFRKMVPLIGGVDISPIILIICLQVLLIIVDTIEIQALRL